MNTDIGKLISLSIDEEIEKAKEYASNEGYKKDDTCYWAYAIGCIKSVVKYREKKFLQRISELERKTDYLRRTLNELEGKLK